MPIPNDTVRKALGEMFPNATFLAPTLFQLWTYRPWKIGPGGAGVIYTVVYGSTGVALKVVEHQAETA